MDYESERRADAVEWLRLLFPELGLASDASEGELRAALEDGAVLCGILSGVNADFAEQMWNVESGGNCGDAGSDNLRKFLSAVGEMGLTGFSMTDLEQGSIAGVVECLLSLRDHFGSDVQQDSRYTNGFCRNGSVARKKWYTEVGRLERLNSMNGDHAQNGHDFLRSGENEKNASESESQQTLNGSAVSESFTTQLNHAGEIFHEVFQLRQGPFSDIPAARVTELMKLNDFNNASIPTLLKIAYGIVDESNEKNREIPYHAACLLRRILQEIEQHFSSQSERLQQLNCIAKEREEKYNLRMRALGTLVTGTTEEIQLTKDQLQLIKSEKMEIEEKQKTEEQGMIRLIKEKENCEKIIADLKKEMEQTCNLHEDKCIELETTHRKSAFKLEERLKEVQMCLVDSQRRTRELEASSEMESWGWSRKELIYKKFITLQSQSVQDLRVVSKSVKRDMLNIHKDFDEEFTLLGKKLKGLTDAAENYHTILSENRRLYNEVQELKGNIRVYCRIRPFLPGQDGKSCIGYIGENGELSILNPTKQGKDGQRMFKFNKIFGPTASQEDVFLDTQPLIRSVLDGYNVCIFAYGQTGSGKTYTMSGPNAPSKEDWGVNYRALNDLFYISRTRRNTFLYEVGVQMVEIYNEQVRDLLVNDSSQKRLGIWNSSQPNGLAVPDASLHPVKSTSDVIELMQIGQMNRAVGATALNERSSRSHSVVTVHVRGTDLESDTSLRGCLHLIDLAGSERIDRSEATGDRLKEAQHINKSLSALGDVIFALAQKNAHVPYRNSKLTQVLQSSLGGQAKTLMFVQINPDIESYSETVSTLKFAERVSGVELGSAKSNKESKDIRDLLEQVASLKDVLARKDEEIERLRLQKDMRPQYANLSSRKLAANSQRPFLTANTQRRQKFLGGRPVVPLVDKAASDPEICSDYSDRHSEVGSLQSMDDLRHHREFFCHSRTMEEDSADIDLLGLDGGDLDERLSDISDSVLSMGTETDGSMSSAVEFTLFPEVSKQNEDSKPNEVDRSLDESKQSDSIKLLSDSKASDAPKEKSAASIPRLPPSPMHKARPSALAQSRLKETLRSTSLPRRASTSLLASSTTRPLRRRP